ncbi:MAG: putative membrane protein [Limisphaerales bacterium]|jgi:putative membrane protein
MKLSTHSKLKPGGALILAILCGIVVLQNTETVEARILFLSISMPRAFLLLGTTAIGLVIGVLVTPFFQGRSKATP